MIDNGFGEDLKQLVSVAGLFSSGPPLDPSVHSKAVLACWDLLKDLVGSFFFKMLGFPKNYCNCCSWVNIIKIHKVCSSIQDIQDKFQQGHKATCVPLVQWFHQDGSGLVGRDAMKIPGKIQGKKDPVDFFGFYRVVFSKNNPMKTYRNISKLQIHFIHFHDP